MQPDFRNLVSDKCLVNQAGSFFGLAVLSGLSLFFLWWAIRLGFAPLFFLAAIPLLGIFILYVRFKGDLKGSAYWIGLIENDPQQIVWIKPIETRHTAALVVTLYRDYHFQLITRSGLKLTLKCNHRDEQELLFEAIADHLPHAHIGYSVDAEIFFSEDPNLFLDNLQKAGIYRPISAWNQEADAWPVNRP